MHSAVDGDGSAGESSDAAAGEEADRLGDLGSGDEPAGRLAGVEGDALGVRVVGLFEQARHPRGVDGPGLTQLTRMPSATWSAAIAMVSERTAPFDAEYNARLGSPAVAAIEQVLTIAGLSLRRSQGRASGRG